MRNYWLPFIIISICTIKSMEVPNATAGKPLDIKQQAVLAFVVTRSELTEMQKLKSQMEEKVKELANHLDNANKEHDAFVTNANRKQKISFIAGLTIGCFSTAIIYWKLKSSD